MRVSILTAAAAALAMAAPASAQPVLNSQYLTGEWAVGDAQCADPNAEIVTFLESGAFMSRNNGALDAVGFWSIDEEEEIVDIEVFASPSFVRETALGVDVEPPTGIDHVPLAIRVVAVKPEADTADIVAVAGSDIWQGTLNRCE